MGFFRVLLGFGDYPSRKEIEQQIDKMIVKIYENEILENSINVTGDMIRSHLGVDVGEPRYEAIKANPFMEKFFYDYGLNIFFKGFHFAHAIESGDNSTSSINSADRCLESFRQEILQACFNAFNNDIEIAEVFNTVGGYLFDAGMKYGHDYGQQELYAFEKRR